MGRRQPRRTGYYVVKNDWPTSVPGVDMSSEELYAALDRIDTVDESEPARTPPRGGAGPSDPQA